MAIPSATITLYQLSHMWCSINHMVKTSAYKNSAITSAIMAITSAKHRWLTICHNTIWLLSLNTAVYITHFNNSDYNICHKGITAITSLAITSANNIYGCKNMTNICHTHYYLLTYHLSTQIGNKILQKTILWQLSKLYYIV